MRLFRTAIWFLITDDYIHSTRGRGEGEVLQEVSPPNATEGKERKRKGRKGRKGKEREGKGRKGEERKGKGREGEVTPKA